MRLGVYIRGLSKERHGTPAQAAKKAASNGLAFVPILVCWQEPGRPQDVNTRVLYDYVKAFSEAGVEPWIWGYPWVGREDEYLDRFQLVLDTCRGLVRGIIHDPELGYRFKTSDPVQAHNGTQKILAGTLDMMNESMGLKITSYGWIKDFPWSSWLAGEGSPQFYKATEAQIRVSLPRWKNAGWKTLYPSVPAFGPNSGPNLGPYMDLIAACAKDTGLKIEGYIVWSWRQMNVIEWRTLKHLSQ